jgi:hypothetical protein
MLGVFTHLLEAYLKHSYTVKASRKEENMILVTYDLNSPGQKYQRLIQTIKSTGDWCHCLESTWLLRTSLTAEQVATHLRQQIDANDNLLVIAVNPRSIGARLPQEACNWINGYVNR